MWLNRLEIADISRTEVMWFSGKEMRLFWRFSAGDEGGGRVIESRPS